MKASLTRFAKASQTAGPTDSLSSKIDDGRSITSSSESYLSPLSLSPLRESTLMAALGWKPSPTSTTRLSYGLLYGLYGLYLSLMPIISSQPWCWCPALLPSIGIHCWYLALVSSIGIQRWYPALVSSVGIQRLFPFCG